MHQVFEALVDETGRVFLAEPVRFERKRRAVVVVLDDDPVTPRTWTEPPIGMTKASEAQARYKISRLLGQGGMGRTYVGIDTQTGRTVCIKQLRPGFQPEILTHEWQSLARVESEYVVQFLDRYEEQGVLHVVMEYVDGPTLAQRWQRTDIVRGDVRWLALCLMRGLSAIHRHAVIHCDLKPQNILVQDRTLAPSSVEPSWIPRVIDFGIAILDRHDAEGRLTGEGRIAGTPAYMAPEQARGWMVTPACDIYAAGLILWESIIGKPAFVGDSYSILAAKACLEEGLRVEPLPPDIPAEVAELIERCTQPHPSRRPTADEAEAWLLSHASTLTVA